MRCIGNPEGHRPKWERRYPNKASPGEISYVLSMADIANSPANGPLSLKFGNPQPVDVNRAQQLIALRHPDRIAPTSQPIETHQIHLRLLRHRNLSVRSNRTCIRDSLHL